MSDAKVAPYGEWVSPIGPEFLTTGSLRLGKVAIDGEDLYWIEGRSSEGGRSVLVRQRDGGEAEDITPLPFNVRTKAHEYGGGALLASGGRVWFCNFEDQRIYEAQAEGDPRALTEEGPFRYADMILDSERERLICVLEDHSGDGEAVNTIVGVSLADGSARVLAEGHDFCSTPSLSADGGQLAWLTWDHPNMPWDETEVRVAAIQPNGGLGPEQVVFGGQGVSCFQPLWHTDGRLYFAADPDGWWNLHRWNGRDVRCVGAMQAEFGQPQWVFGMRTFGFAGDGAILCAYCVRGEWRLGRLHADTGAMTRCGAAWTEIDTLGVSGNRAVIVAGDSRQAAAVIEINLDSGERTTHRNSLKLELESGYISGAEPVKFATSGGETAYGFFYAPANKDYVAPAGELPPLIVMSHGGPTAASSSALSLKIQYWTSRGFAVLDVNYRGSTGYGRAYRELLKGNWGIADVADCVHGALYLAEIGKVDGARLAIRGGSAGGYTTLAAITFHDVFRAGASYYGVADLETLARDTHKFESRYLDSLIGPYPERRHIYHERSPIYHVNQLSSPAIFFQGLEDEIVPPNQAEAMVSALREKGLPVAYLTFAGEQHGFRKAETIRRTLEAELYFYGRVFGFKPAGEIEAVEIENL